MGAMRLPLRPTKVKPSLSLLEPGAPTLPAAWRDHWLICFLYADLSSAEAAPSSIEDSASPIRGGEVVLGGSVHSDFTCFLDNTSLRGDAIWRLACFHFGCEAGAD
ncbi:hypothetical protein TNCV_3486121 [Trichonephila clavipes]|nr:hypothetical protein TNCV_3486121 [Trichonephila clavipes]